MIHHLRSFRITTNKKLFAPVQELLQAEGFRFEPEPFSSVCFRLVEEPFPLGSSLAAFFGHIYIQDRSSMLPPLALAPDEGGTVLDMCASPGSKTGLLAQLVGENGFVLANEVSRQRLATLRANLRTCNVVQAGTCSYSGDAIPLREGSFAAILLDPPCSGWGTAEKNPKVLELWRESKVKPLIVLQRRLLTRAAQLLAPGGRLVYSTCTTNSAENEEQVAWAEAELGLEREPLPLFAGFVWDPRAGSEGTLRVDGEKSQAQGFYVARLRRPGQGAPVQPGEGTGSPAPARLAPLPGEIARDALAGPTLVPGRLPGGRCVLYAGTVRFLPQACEEILPEGFVWQAAPLGRFGAGGFQADERLRVFMEPSARSLVLDEVGEVRSLLSGVSRKVDLGGKEAGLWWRNLPLGKVSLRSGRVIASFR